MTQPRHEEQARILVVDDEPQNLELMEAILQDAGYSVFSASGGGEALALANAKRPDLIILDLMMPGLSGFEVCARVKTDPQTGGTPVLFVTALNQIGDKERALAAGGDDFLTKPVQYAELLARVEALLKVRHLNRDLDRALAYLRELEQARHAPQADQTAARSGPPIGAPVLLVVDDEPLVRHLLCDILHEAGYATHAAESGPQAVEIAGNEVIDVVLLDLMMPGMSGLDVLAKLGELVPNSPVIIVTASPTSENAIAALRLGAFDFVVKGFTSDTLLSTVARAVERRRMMVRDRALISQLEAKTQRLLAILAERTQESDRSSERGQDA
jgi:two-component system cell cycle response regulator